MAEELVGAQKAQKLARIRLTKHCTIIQKVLDKGDDVTAAELEGLIMDYRTRATAAEDAHNRIADNVEDEDLEQVITEAEDYMAERNNTLYQAVTKLASMPPATATSRDEEEARSNASVASYSSGNGGSKNSKLPKLDLPRFGGDLLKWSSFRESFINHVHSNSSISLVSKFTHLLSLLDGDAMECVQGFSLTEESYKDAWDLLEQQFGRPAQIKLCHVSALLRLEAPRPGKGSAYVKSLYNMLNTIQTHVRSLANLGVKGELVAVLLCPLIISRFPEDIALEWSRNSEDRESDLNFTLEFLRKEIRRLERASSIRTALEKVEPLTTFKTSTDKPKGSVMALYAHSEAPAVHGRESDSKGWCTFHKSKGHRSKDCNLFKMANIQARRQMVNKARACYRCLGGHKANQCNHKCTRCGFGHHPMLCTAQNGGVGAANGPRPTHYMQPGQGRGTSFGPANAGYVQQPAANAAFGSHPPAFGPHSSSYNGQPAHDAGATIGSQNGFSRVQHQGTGSGSSRQGANVALTTQNMDNMSTVLQTANVRVKGLGQEVSARIMFDSGSDRSYIETKLVKLTNPRRVGQKPISYSSFGGEGTSKTTIRSVYDIDLLGSDGVAHKLSVIEVPVICATITRSRLPDSILQNFKNLPLADVQNQDMNLQVQILIGLDFYWHFINSSLAIQHGSLVAQMTPFGYVLSGCWENTSKAETSHTQLLCISDTTHQELEKFWKLEHIGIMPKESAQPAIDRNPVLIQFYQDLEYSAVLKKYMVGLTWISDAHKENLVNNIGIAVKRLDNLDRKLDQDPVFKEKYYHEIDTYIKQEFVEVIPPNQIESSDAVFYMPHRPIYKPQATTTKIRPVFDCSAKSYNGRSLNDMINKGPSLTPDLVEVTLRFRRWPVAISGDVGKAFLQLYVKPSDRDVHRFLIRRNGKLIHLRFTRVPFGNTASPFILNAVIRHHLSLFPDSAIRQELIDNLFVDNWLSGGDDVAEALKKFQQALEMLASAGFHLDKWCSSNESVIQHFRDSQVFVDDDKVLGLKWIASNDTFGFDGFYYSSLPIPSTKRALLSILARFFDPLGLIGPHILVGKLLFQKVWQAGTGWDDTLTNEMAKEFQCWMKSSSSLDNMSIDRAYFPDLPWGEVSQSVELHCFGDASEKAYGACVYLRILTSNGYKVSLAMSRNRVAPIKKVTLPRLELLAALLCARLAEYVKIALRVSKAKVTCYTDSMVSLGWIKGDPLKYKSFISNRVSEIQSLVSPSQWYHCPGRYNPADLVSRGLLADELIDCTLWLKGPDWLSKFEQFPQAEESLRTVYHRTPEVSQELKAVTCCTSSRYHGIFNFRKFSHLNQVITNVAWVIRFVINCRLPRGERISGPLTLAERAEAQEQLWRSLQRLAYREEVDALEHGKQLPKGSSLTIVGPFLDYKGLLRILGRLQNSELSYDAKHPIILPYSYVAALLVRFQHQYLKHAGVEALLASLRGRFHITKARRLAKTTIKYCIGCQKQDARALDQVGAPLPGDRVRKAPPFGITGVDYAGPIYLSDRPSKKFYILLFTCGVIRALHLELTPSLNLSDFCFAFRRFSARRGVPSVVWSDNAKTFEAASTKLHNHYGPNAPTWKFIAPRAPFWGGWWERLVRSVKTSLRKTIGNRCLKRQEFEVTLCEVEAAINSRPLTKVSPDPSAEGPLTPDHFLKAHSGDTNLNGDEILDVTASQLTELHLSRQTALAKFWDRWSKEYITNLPPVVRNRRDGGSLEVGDLVLIREDNAGPRLKWPLGRVVEVHPGADGKIRAVDLQTARGNTLTRPIQKLHRLEVWSSPVLNEFSDIDPKFPSDSLDTSEQMDICEPMDYNEQMDCDNLVIPEIGLVNSNNAPDESEVVVTRYGRRSRPPKRYNCN